MLSFGRQDAAERRLKVHRDIPFARDPSLHVAFDWGDPYWKMASAASGGCLAANAFDCALALAQLIKEAQGKAWVYEFGVPGVLTHAVCVVEEAGKWWVEDPFFDTTFKTPLAKVLDSLGAGGEPDRTPEKTERICIIRAGDTATADALAPLAKHELQAIGDVRRYAAPLRRETYLGFLDDPDLLFEALEDRGLPRAFDALMLLPLRGLCDGDPMDLPAAPGDPGAWFAARQDDKRRMRREAVAQERALARLTRKAREQRDTLQAELVAAVSRAEEAESARGAELQTQLQRTAEEQARATELQAAVEAAEARAAELRAAIEAAEARAAELQAAAQSAETRAVERQAAVEAAEARAVELRTAVEGAETHVAERQAAVEAAEARVVELEAGAQAAEARATELQAAVEAAETRAAERQAAADSAETRAAELRAAAQAAQARAEDLERRATIAEASEARLGRENGATAAVLQTAQADAAVARDEANQLEVRLEQLRVTADAAALEAAAARDEIKQLKEQVERHSAAADSAALEAAAAVEQRVAADDAADHLRQALAAETERAARAEQGLEAKRAALSRTRGRALAALQRAAGAARELDGLSQVLEETRRAADQSLDDLRRQQESDAGEAAERLREAQAASEVLRAELATLAADHEDQGLRAQAEAAAARDEVKQLEQKVEQHWAAADSAALEAAAAVELRVAAEETAEHLRQALAAEAERAGRAEQGFEAKRAALSRTRGRALAALHKTAGTRRELDHLSQILEETRRAADQSLDDLRRQQASERGEAAERLRESEASSEALRVALATLAADHEEQGQRAQADAAAARDEVKQLEQRLEQLRAAADDAAREAAAAVELRVAAEETAGHLREELAAETERAGRAEQGLAIKRAVLSRTRGRALAALQKAGRAARELDHMSLVLEETRRAADQSLDDLRRRQERERGEAAERLRQAEEVSDALRADLATLAAGYEEQGLRARAHVAELQAERAGFETELRSAERANLALDAAVEASAAREAGLVASADTLRREVSELETARRSLSLALEDASSRELALESARRALTQALDASAAREAALMQDADGLRGRVADLAASEGLKARVLENVVSRAAAIGDFEADGLDAFDALEKVSLRLTEVSACRDALAARLAAATAEHDRRLSLRIGRMFGLARKRPEGETA